MTGAILLARALRRASTSQAARDVSTNDESRDIIFRQLAENIQQVFWMADCKQGRLIYVSPAMLDLWLVEPQLIINDPSQWFASIHSADRSKAEESYAAMLSGKVNSCEYRLIRPDGEIRFVRNRCFPVPDASGIVARMAGILEDVTSEHHARRQLQDSRDELVQHVNELKSENRERRRAEEQLIASRDLAEAGSRAKSQFLSNISHELRTPLTGIIGMIQIALDGKPGDDQRECLQSAASSALNLLGIVDDILDFSEADTGRLRIGEAPFSPRECVRDIVKRISSRSSQKGLEFAWLVAADVPDWVTGDSRRLSKVLTHLISNAVKFTSEGTVGLEVCRTQDSSGNPFLRFIVSDTGIGVPAESRLAIFEAFTQADGSLTRSYGGVGLGLAISSRLVTLMGGQMSLESEIGQGSRFTFTVAMRGVKEESPAPNRAPSKRGTVLIVDSNSTSSRFAARALTADGIEVRCCLDKDQALLALKAGPNRFAAILLASELGQDSGLVLAELISKEYSSQDKILITWPQARDIEQVAKCRELGLVHHFARPVDYDDMRARLRSLVSGPPQAAGTQSAISTRPTSSIRPMRVLLVEDNPINQTVLKRMLQRLGHSVLTADHGLQGLQKLEEAGWNIDLVMTDVQMPEMDGYDMTARIRNIEQSRGGHLPILAATAHAMVGDCERCLSAGMDAYISKPIQFETLSKTIAEVMSGFGKDAELERKVS